MRKYVIYFCLAWALGACGNRQLHKQLGHLIASEIIIPVEMKRMVGQQDTVVLDPAVGDARLVVWVDSVACSTCQLSKMFIYKNMIDYRVDAGNEYSVVFLFSPPRAKIDEVMQTLEFSRFEYPVFIDENQAFTAANPHIPADSRFHTFLLDKNGKVVLVGDPVNNPALWELYKSAITTLIENDGVMPEPETEK